MEALALVAEQVLPRRQDIQSLSAHSHPPSFPRKRESMPRHWIPGLRFTPSGMTGSGVVASFSRSPNSLGMAGVLRVSAPSHGAESLFVYSNKKGRKNAAHSSRCFLRFSARPGVGRRVHSRGQRRPSLACPFGPDPAEPAILGRSEGEI